VDFIRTRVNVEYLSFDWFRNEHTGREAREATADQVAVSVAEDIDIVRLNPKDIRIRIVDDDPAIAARPCGKPWPSKIVRSASSIFAR
jgi:hypothetical protein